MAVAAAARRRVIVAWHRMTPPTPEAEALPEAPKNSYLMYICCLYYLSSTGTPSVDAKSPYYDGLRRTRF